MTWDQIYNLFGIKDFIYFISSPSLQEMLLPIKIVFIFFDIFFLIYVIYFMLNSSWMQHTFMQDTFEFFSWQSYGLREINNRWNKIQKRINSGIESELKLAVIEADDFLYKTLEDRGFKGNTIESLLASAGKTVGIDSSDILNAHKMRNAIVYDVDYKINTDDIKNSLSIFEKAIKNIGSS